MEKYVIVIGSSRVESESERIAMKIGQIIKDEFNYVNVDYINLADKKYKITEFHESVEDATLNWNSSLELLRQSKAVVFVVPEWHGLVPSKFLELIIECDAFQLAHKPALLVGISSGAGGAYPIAQIKGFYNKSNRICFVPEHVIIRNVNNMLKDDIDNIKSNYIEERIKYALLVLNRYDKALSIIRHELLNGLDNYTYGM